MVLRVETTEEEPVRIRFASREVHVTQLLDRWYGEEHDYFRVHGDDGRIYLLRHDREEGDWDLRSMTDPGY